MSPNYSECVCCCENDRVPVCCYIRRSSGASRDNLKREIEVLKETEQELRKKVGRLFRRRRGFSIRRITEFFSPTNTNKIEQGGSLRRRWTLRNPRRLFSTGDPQPSIPEEEAVKVEPCIDLANTSPRRRAQTVSNVHHSRTVSDVTEQQSLPRGEDSSSPAPTPSGLCVIVQWGVTHIVCFNSDTSAWRGRNTPVAIPLYTHLFHPCTSLCFCFPMGRSCLPASASG